MASTSPFPVNLSLNKRLRGHRAPFHDYAAPGYYLITINTHPNRPILSRIPDPGDAVLRKDEFIVPDHTPLGRCIQEELRLLTERIPALEVLRYVIMPDHIHFVLFVSRRLERPLGKCLASFTTACSKAYTRLEGLESVSTLFMPFDDNIIFDYCQLDRSIRYVADNPRRYIIKKRYPDLFRRNLHLCIGDREYGSYGNLFLLKSVWLLPVRIHRRWTPQQFEEYSEFCRNAISHGAVPISPAIHKVEKAIIWEAVENGSSVIILRDLSFSERFKPQGKLFDLCSSGRLLLLTPWPDNIRRTSTAGYTEFHKLNDHAAAIAAMPAGSRLAIREILDPG